MESKYIKNGDFACKCGCGKVIKNEGLIKLIDGFVDFIKKTEGDKIKLNVHCITRCEKHHKEIYADINKEREKRNLPPVPVPEFSKHLDGVGCDMHTEGITIKKLHDYARMAVNDKVLAGGVGFYSWGVHCDTGRKRVWTQA